MPSYATLFLIFFKYLFILINNFIEFQIFKYKKNLNFNFLKISYAAPLCVDISERVVKYGAKAGEQSDLHKQVAIGNTYFWFLHKFTQYTNF